MAKVSFNKSGGTAGKNGLTTRITIPKSYIDDMGITQDDREVEIMYCKETKTLTIKKKSSI